MASQIDAKPERRRGRPKGSTNKILRRKPASVDSSDTTPANDAYKECLIDWADTPLPQPMGRLDSCTKAAIAVKGSLNAQARPIILDLEDDDNDANGNELLAALLEDAKFLRETNINVPHPSEMKRTKREISLHGSDTSCSPERKQRKRNNFPLCKPETIARDVLRAAGIHPTLPPLNWHLLQKG